MRTQWTAKGNRDPGSSCSRDRGLHRYLQNSRGWGGGFEHPKTPSVRHCFMVTPCINNIQHFIYQLTHTTLKNVDLLKHSKTPVLLARTTEDSTDIFGIFWCRIHGFVWCGGLRAKSMTSQRYQATYKMADMRCYGNVMTTTRWRLYVILHLQKYSRRLNLFFLGGGVVEHPKPPPRYATAVSVSGGTVFHVG